MVEPKEQFGYIIVAAELCILGIVAGDSKRVVGRFRYDIPKKHRNGGYSANRFQRIRTEVRHTYLSIVGEESRRKFLTPSQIPIVTGIIIAGAAELKDELRKGEFLGPVLKGIVVGVFDVNYGGEQGFSEAIKLSSSLIGDIALTREEKKLTEIIAKVAKGEPVAIGMREVLEAIEAKAISHLIIFKNFDENHPCGEPMIDWVIDHYKENGFIVSIVSDQSPPGAEFVHGFNGIAGELRFPVIFSDNVHEFSSNGAFDSDFDDEENII